MRIVDLSLFAAYIAFLLVCLYALLRMLDTVLEEYYSLKWQKEFAEDLKLAIEATQPTFDQVIQIARTRKVSNPSVQLIFQRLLRELLTGRDPSLLKHRVLLESYIARMDEAEPFEGMPSDIRIHLERIRDGAPQARPFLEPLTAQIKELLSIYEKQKKQQRYYTTGGFFVGVVGLFFAALAYFYPYSPSATEKGNSVPTANADSANSKEQSKPSPASAEAH